MNKLREFIRDNGIYKEIENAEANNNNDDYTESSVGAHIDVAGSFKQMLLEEVTLLNEQFLIDSDNQFADSLSLWYF